MIDEEKGKQYWKENSKIVINLLILWALFSFGIQMIPGINSFSIAGWPFGYYMGAQGTLIAFIFIIIAYVRLMNKLDKKYNLDEEGE